MNQQQGTNYAYSMLGYCRANRDILTEAAINDRAVESPYCGVIEDVNVMRELAADYRARSLWWRRQIKRMTPCELEEYFGQTS